MDDAARIAIAKNYLRRKYANDAEGLRTLMDTVASCLDETVTLTGNSFEGGSASGQITFERMAYLAAIMDVLDEIDPDNAPEAPPAVRHADFSCGPLET